MKRILIGYLIDGKNSGIDTYILNVISQINNEDVAIDCLTNHIEPELEKRLNSMGVGLLEIPTLKHPFGHYQATKRIIEQGKYDIAYFNISEAFNSLGVLAAHDCKVKKVIVHSHSSGVNSHSGLVRFMRTFCHTVMKQLVVGRCANEFYTCSYKAGEWMFPKRVLLGKHFHIMNNAVDVSKFSFDRKVRERKREELGVMDRVVVGQIGAFSYQKNSEYVVDIAEALHAIDSRFLVLMIGTGNDFETVRRQIHDRGLEDAVWLLGSRKDVHELVQAMDVFILPSRFEGLPIVAIEAQVSGLRTFLSDTISRESALSDRCEFLPINVSAEKWAEKIINSLPYEREGLELSECTYCFDIRKQNDQIRKIFG